MSNIKNLLWKSVEYNKRIDIVAKLHSRWANFEDDIYLNLEHPWFAEFFQFFSAMFDSHPINADEKNFAALYYFYKAAYKKLPAAMDKFDKWKEINLRDFLINVFFEALDSRIPKIPNCVNKYPDGLENLINWEELRKEYPLAAKSNYYLLKNKTFLEETKKKFLADYSSKNIDFYDNIMDQVEKIEDPRVLYKELIETLTDIETSDNMIKTYIEEYLLFSIFNRFYLDNEKKENRLNQKNDKAEISDEEKRIIFKKMVDTEEIEQISNINLLNDEQKNTIDEIIKKFDMLGEKEKKKIKRYIIRLAVKKKPFKVVQFLKNNNLNGLPEWVIWLLDDLMLDIIDEWDVNAVSEDINEDLDDSEKNTEVVSIATISEWINKEIFDLFKKDPVSAVIKKAKLCNYGIENENLLRKQIETICLSSKLVKDSLLISLLKNTFSKPILKNSWAYSLRAWGSGYRFVLRQNEKRKFIIVWFYNHDDYEQVIDSRKW